MKSTLLPNKFLKIGFILIPISMLLLILKFLFEIELPLFKEVTVFSIYPVFLKMPDINYVTNTNISYTVYTIMLLIGLLLISISEQKNENEFILKIRFDSFVIALKTYILINLIACIAVWGIGTIFVYASMLWLNVVLYNCIFYYKLYRFNKAK